MDASVLDELYQDLIMDRAHAPRHGSGLACYDAEGEGNNPMCGDRVTVQIRRDGAGGIEAVGFRARGCAISVASADLMADVVEGLNETTARRLHAEFEMMAATGEVPPGEAFASLAALAGVHRFRSRVRCATLPWSALEGALASGGGR